MENALHMIGWGCMGLGAFFLLTAAVGLWRMPEFFTRLHPAGVADSMGAPLVLVGIALLTPIGLETIKIILLLMFALYTSATACHALAKAALLSGEPLMGRIEAKPSAKKRRKK